MQDLLKVDPWCDLLSSVSVTVDSAIDRLIHSAKVAHCTHTMDTMASNSHSGGPTAFRLNPSIAMTLSRPLRLTPHWATPGWPRVYQRHNDHRRGQNINVPHGDRYQKSQQRAHKVMSAYRARVLHTHNLPSLEAPTRGMTTDRIKAFP